MLIHSTHLLHVHDTERTLLGAGDTTGLVGDAKSLSAFPGRAPVLQSEQNGAVGHREGFCEERVTFISALFTFLRDFCEP